MMDPLREMRLLAGKVALLLAGVYVFVLVATGISFAHGYLPSLRFGVLILVPVAVFVPAVIAAIQLHRSSDAERMKRLWRRSLVLSVAGAAMMFSVAYIPILRGGA